MDGTGGGCDTHSPTGVSYKSPKLIRMGVFQVGDLLEADKLDEEKVKHIAPTWQGLYRQGVQWMLRQRDEGKEDIRISGQHIEMDQWALKRVAVAMAPTNKPEERQSPEVWARLEKLQAPWKMKSFVGQALWRKLAVNLRLQQKGIRNTALCPLCQGVEDHEHRLKKCTYFEVPFQLVRAMLKRVKLDGKVVEPSRMCLEAPDLSLRTTQGVVLWTAIHALWNYRCEVQFGRQKLDANIRRHG